jgi:KaiC/GvpD/RAD55 family RecA-like ATPase
MKADTHRIAHELLAMGLKPVRLMPGEKKAIEPGWTSRVHDGLTVRAEFKPGENVGALMGEPSGWIVDIDLDDARAPEVARTLLPHTRMFGRAGKRGSHYLYRVVGAKTRKWQGAGGMIVELRSTGTQTMMPGSVHPSGEMVEWENDLPIMPIDPVKLHGLLDELARACGWTPDRGASVEVKGTSAGHHLPPGFQRNTGYGAAALDSELRKLADTTEGGRNDQLNRCAFAIAQLVDMGELPAEAMDMVRTVAIRTGLDTREVESTIRSATAGAATSPRAPRDGRDAPRYEPPPKPAKEAIQAVSKGLMRELMDDLASSQGQKVGGIPIPGFKVLTNYLFGLRGSCLFTAPSGTGKTTLVNSIALNVARGCCALGEDRHEPVPVVYFTAEMSRADIALSMVTSEARVPTRAMVTGETDGEHGTTASGALKLTEYSRAKVDAAVRVMDELERTGMLSVIDAHGVMRPWSREHGEHALSGLQEAVEALHPGRRVLVIVDTLATLEPTPSVGERRMTDLDTDTDIVNGLKRWRAALPVGSCILCIHEESKALTGTGDGHSVRGSSKYLFSTTQRLTMMSAASDGGTRHEKVRKGKEEDGVHELDILVSKARRGGHGHTTVLVTHDYRCGVFKEVGGLTMMERKKLKAEAKKKKKTDDEEWGQ